MSSKRYTEEFKVEAVKQITERGYSVSSVARRLGVTTHSLYAWRKKYGNGSEQSAQRDEQQAEIDADNGVAGRKPGETYPWYFNVCRQRLRANGAEHSAFSPTGTTGFHELMKFGRLYVR